MPPAPLTFSTSTVWPSSARKPSATMRAIASLDPPAANGTTSVIGRAGQSCASAAAPDAQSAAAAAIIRMHARSMARPPARWLTKEVGCVSIVHQDSFGHERSSGSKRAGREDRAPREECAMQRQLHLNLFIHGRGHHEAAWRHPGSSPLALTDIRYYQDLAQRAEAARFDSIFLADQLALGEDVAQAARTWLEPITVLAAIAVATKRIGLIATASTTYTEPFNLARQFASVDHISQGRAAWNIVTSWLATAA